MKPLIIALIVLIMLIALIIGGILGYYWKVGLSSSDVFIFMTISLGGAFGGLLYAARDGGVKLPRKDPKDVDSLKLGWVADCGYGIAGGYVVFLVLPTDVATGNQGGATMVLVAGNVLGLVKLLALALVGGYGGRSLVDRALATITQEVEKAKEEVKEAQKSAQETKRKIVQIQETDTRALELVDAQLDDGEEPPNTEALKDAVKAASKSARFEIFKEARAVRTATWKNNVPLMERTIPIFEALIDNDAKEEFHRNHGQLGYALKDCSKPKRDWERSHRELSKAIELRDKEGTKGFLMYEFNRAICSIELEKDFDDIDRDLHSAAQRKALHNKIEKENVFVKWSAKNGYDLRSLKKV